MNKTEGLQWRRSTSAENLRFRLELDCSPSFPGLLLCSLSKAHFEENKPCQLVLPITVNIGGRTKQYVWNGEALKGIDVETLHRQDSNPKTHGDKLRDPIKWIHHEISHAFFPHPDEVTPDYWKYASWRAVHRFFSSMNSVFATQSLLQAVGVGARRSLPAAATINWVLKDGLGRLGRLGVATQFGASFDADLKRFRYGTSILYCIALALEYSTPLAPAAFLPLASLANVGKSIGLATYVATQPAFHRSFARSENLADISAKGQGQQMVLDNVGLAAAILLTHAVRESEPARRALPLLMFPLLVMGDLVSIYQEMKSIHLRSINRERAELLAANWIDKGSVLTPQQVSKEERLLLAPAIDRGALPLGIGGPECSVQSSVELQRFLDGLRRQRYFLAVHPRPRPTAGPRAWLRVRPRSPGTIQVSLRGDAGASDVLQAVLQAAVLRRGLAPGFLAGCPLDSEVEAARQAAAAALDPFIAALREEGWQTDSFLLSRGEKARYSLLD